VVRLAGATGEQAVGATKAATGAAGVLTLPEGPEESVAA
jgi:hypothetical protein